MRQTALPPLVEEGGAAVVGGPPFPVGVRSPGDFVVLLLDKLVLNPGETGQGYSSLIYTGPVSRAIKRGQIRQFEHSPLQIG